MFLPVIYAYVFTRMRGNGFAIQQLIFLIVVWDILLQV